MTGKVLQCVLFRTVTSAPGGALAIRLLAALPARLRAGGLAGESDGGGSNQ